MTGRSSTLLGSLGAIVSLFLLACSDSGLEPVDDFPANQFPQKISIDTSEYRQRRDALMDALPGNAVFIIATNQEYNRNGDVDYAFRPQSDFYYLTGFDEPQAVAILRRSRTSVDHSELIMFVQDRTPIEVQWHGPVYGPEGAVQQFGADRAFRYTDFAALLTRYIHPDSDIVVFGGLETDPTVSGIFNDVMDGRIRTESAASVLAALRAIKSAAEIRIIQRAVDLSVLAFGEAIKRLRPGMYEYETAAMLRYTAELNGSTGLAFPTIVASGPNINILHYVDNNREMQDGELVMVDFGAEYNDYASDLTRTLPVSGKFTSNQAQVYEIVREAHRRVVGAAAPGVSYYDLYYQARNQIIEDLLDQGIIKGKLADIINSGAYLQYIPAGLGHSLGLDVHDPFPREENGDRVLRENMVMAFEPHVYLYEGDETVEAQYQNISVRLEDTVLITADGCRVLSSALPLDMDAIVRDMH